MDRDFDGRLSFGEFMGEETPLEKVFKSMDKDGDGTVTMEVNSSWNFCIRYMNTFSFQEFSKICKHLTPQQVLFLSQPNQELSWNWVWHDTCQAQSQLNSTQSPQGYCCCCICCCYLLSMLLWFVLARACGVPAVGVRAVDCWQWRSGHYFHPYFLLLFSRFFFSPSRPFLIEGVLGSKNLFSESCLECPKT